MTLTKRNPQADSRVHRPIAATIAIVIGAGSVLPVRPANPPDVERWGFPSGKIEIGETTQDAVVRERLEETGVCTEARQTFTAVHSFDHDGADRLRQHFVLIAVLCRWVSGEPVTGDDALKARWFHLEELYDESLALSLDVAVVARQAARLGEG